MKRLSVWLFLLCGVTIATAKTEMPSASKDSFGFDPLTQVLNSPAQIPINPLHSSAPLFLDLTTPSSPAPSLAVFNSEMPEPATVALLGLGAVAICGYRRRLRC